jgi:hypothetical protein
LLERTRDIALAMELDAAGKPAEEGVTVAAEAVKKLSAELNIPKLRDLDVPRDIFDRIAEDAVREISTLFNPRAGGTVYLDAAKTWSVSALGRYEIHTEKEGEDLRAGDDFHFEWGIGKALPPDWKIGSLQFWEVGVAGYAQWQVTDDRGDDVTWDKDKHDRVFAAGPEIRCMIPQWKLLLELRCEKEFGAVDRSEGWLTAFVLTKAF